MPLETIQDPAVVLHVPFNPPHSFGLYAKLCLSEHEGPLPFQWSRGVWSSLVQTEEGHYIPVEVAQDAIGSVHSLRIAFHGDPSSKDLKNIVKMISEAFCTDLDLNCFYATTGTDDALRFLARELRGLKPDLSMRSYEALIKAIIRQLIRASSARDAISLLVKTFGGKNKLGHQVFYSFPTPLALAQAKKSELLGCKLGFKWKLIREISRDVVCGDLDLDDLSRQTNEEIIRVLEEYRGIGYWTSRIFLYDGLKRLNSYPIQDISLRRAISELYYEGCVISWMEVQRFFKAWTGWTGILVTYMFGYLWLKRLGKL